MKKTFILTILLGIVRAGFCQPQFNALSFPNSVNLFEKFEVYLTLSNSYSNPYDPDLISINASFYSPDGTTYQVDAFYFEGYTFNSGYGVDTGHFVSDSIGWKIRFTPNQVGKMRGH